jgi:hypothetical protein
MNKSLVFFFITALLLPSIALPQKTERTIQEFKVQAMYRAAKLTWKANPDLKSAMAVQVLRADTFEEGPYKEVTIIQLTPGKTAYDYIDKSMGSESKYFYKLVIKSTGETFGPLPTRPFFSPPAT